MLRPTAYTSDVGKRKPMSGRCLSFKNPLMSRSSTSTPEFVQGTGRTVAVEFRSKADGGWRMADGGKRTADGCRRLPYLITIRTAPGVTVSPT
jgi:hypothetical protein